MCLQIYFHDISKNSQKWADFTDFIKKRPTNLLFQKFEILISGIIFKKKLINITLNSAENTTPN